jgi:predicted secreted protein
MLSSLLDYLLLGTDERMHVKSKARHLTLSGTLASAPARTKHLRMFVEPAVAAIIKGVSLQLPSTSAPA